MSEPRQVKIKDAAAMFQYSTATLYRMVRRGILPSTGRGALLRIPIDAIEAKIARMQEGEDLWHGASETIANDDDAVVAVSGKTAKPASGGPPTKTKKANTAAIVQLVARPPNRS